MKALHYTKPKTALKPDPTSFRRRSGLAVRRVTVVMTRSPDRCLDLVEERLVADAEDRGRFLAVPMGLLQHFQDQLALGFACRGA